MAVAPDSSDTGHTLGGHETAASQEEIRRRRLDAMEKRHPAPATSTGVLPNPLRLPSPMAVSTVEDDGEDDELQAALALSMQTEPTSPSKEINANVNVNANATGEADGQSVKGEAQAQVQVQTEETPLEELHAILWDDNSTTFQDKERWLQQAISTPALLPAENSSTASLSQSIDSLESFTQSFDKWGLTQGHGGPCGVLAALQAELLSGLLYTSGGDTYPPSLEKFSVPTDLSPSLLEEALAKAIGIVLARAAIAPSAGNDDTNTSKTTPIIDTEQIAVRLVLPLDISSDEPLLDNYEGLNWQDLTSSGEGPQRLTTNVIRLVSSNHQDHDAPNTKRQKKAGDNDDDSLPVSDLTVTTSPILVSIPEDIIGRMDALGNAVAKILLQNNAKCLRYFYKVGGVMLMTMSLALSRGIAKLQSEMDDPQGTRLTSQFGHCGQELLNLLLTGQAVSNVFDNSMTLSGSLVCRGISAKPNIGYLTQLESLRYCEVGGYYKSPHLPIWVVGSTSHFSVLFGTPPCLVESKSDQLLEQCRRAFKAVEGGDENGFIPVDSLGSVIRTLNLFDKIGGDAGVQTLSASIQVHGAGIILWDDFWKASSRLLTGATLVSVLDNDLTPTTVENSDINSNDSLPMLTQFGEPSADPASSFATATTNNAGAMSDEELAKQLAAEWGTGDQQFYNSFTTNTAEQHTAKTDEELALELSRQWDAEATAAASFGDAQSSVAVAGSSIGESLSIGSNMQDAGDDEMEDDKKMSAHAEELIELGMEQETAVSNNNNTTSSTLPPLAFETFGETFPLFHYNGLRGGSLTNFRVTRLSPEEAVGASIASESGSGKGGSTKSGDLEDVVRTKWPSCMINWGGKDPPFID